ncbi:TraC family protein [Pelagibius sp. Alg239-R121]|uniref:TraC family protein n=1 Tax=Pelagibius sp. Alg239-R121 TaxID=2993448 RepID=UPI0024A716DC|nr:TraC family protein [Pelagibius sp. Alg239-R121]
MARKPLSQKRSELADKMAALEKQMAQLEQAEVENIGKLAKEAGLVGLDISDDQLREAFKGIAARFRSPRKEAGKASSQAATA